MQSLNNLAPSERRFLFVLWEGAIGGAERAVVNLAQALRERTAEASVLLLVRGGPLEPILKAAGVRYHIFGLRRGADVLLEHRRLTPFLLSERPAVIVVDTFGYVGAAIRAAGYTGALWGVDHGRLLRHAARKGPHMRERAERTIARLTYTGQVAVSEYMARRCEQFPQGRRFCVIPNPVAMPSMSPPLLAAGPITFGFAGRLVPGKGVDRAIDLIASLRRRGVHAALQIAGEGPEHQRLEQLADRRGVRDAVVFRGWVQAIGEHWARCDAALALNDSFEESFCVSIAEALAHGRPAIVTNLGALPNLVESGVNGYVCGVGAQEDVLAAALKLANRDHIATLSSRARESVRPYAVESVARAYEGLTACS